MPCRCLADKQPCRGCALPAALDLKLEPALVRCQCAFHLLATAALLDAHRAVADAHVSHLQNLNSMQGSSHR